MNIKNIVKNTTARFSFYRAGYMYYEVVVDGQTYRFPVSLEDLGTATLLVEHKAITLMRYTTWHNRAPLRPPAELKYTATGKSWAFG